MFSLFTPWHRGGSGPPLVCVHGFTDTWRTWELVLPQLGRRHDVLAPTLAGHAGGPPLDQPVTVDTLPDALERAMDEAGFATAHIVGNSLGGYLALQLAVRGRAESVVALAPAGGWASDDDSSADTLAEFATRQAEMQAAAEHADELVSTPEGRRQVTQSWATNYEHIPPELLAHVMRGVAACDALPLIELGLNAGFELDAAEITCPVRVVWGTGDLVLPWPSAAERYRTQWLPHADWVELDGIGHCPQLDVPLETTQLILGHTAG